MSKFFEEVANTAIDANTDKWTGCTSTNSVISFTADNSVSIDGVASSLTENTASSTISCLNQYGFKYTSKAFLINKNVCVLPTIVTPTTPFAITNNVNSGSGVSIDVLTKFYTSAGLTAQAAPCATVTTCTMVTDDDNVVISTQKPYTISLTAPKNYTSATVTVTCEFTNPNTQPAVAVSLVASTMTIKNTCEPTVAAWS